jgi:hypothetical protein
MLDIATLPTKARILFFSDGEYFEAEVATPDKRVILLASERTFPLREKGVVLGSFDTDGEFYPGKVDNGHCLALLMETPHRTIKILPPLYGGIVREDYAWA